ncbi:calcium-activated potassium channel subunit beta-3 [Rhinatrema bivittatum]|uniref:calcium-activated potassium channel subunit beta-3 n=1 Tax=Rhinatrema bivittatum TaxID=194408 RepID=UPI0011297DBD|nr:calcium-activated potassium channel subunit beta-3 [Rhinatrema bivittatum]
MFLQSFTGLNLFDGGVGNWVWWSPKGSHHFASPTCSLRSDAMFVQPVAHRQSFSVPIQITLQSSRRRQMREAFATLPAKSKKKEGADGGKGSDKNKKQSSNAGEDRAILLGFTMMGLSILMFFLLVVTILKPFMLSAQREESNCTIIKAVIIDEWVDCSFSCGVDCRGQSKYPCLQILVNLSQSGQKALLHYNEEAIQMNPTCFYTPKCQRDRNDLLNRALDIKGFFEHKNSTPFTCYYSPDGKVEDVILIKKYDRMIIFHCLFWPTLMLIGGALIVGMVKLTQHLSMLCDEYGNTAKEEAKSVAVRPDDLHKGSRKASPFLRWRPNLRTMHHAPLP